MKFIDILRVALGNLRRNTLRSILTITGVVVGIGAIVFLVSLGFGLHRLALEKVTTLDALTVITVTPGKEKNTTLDKEAIEKFKKLDNVYIVTPVLSFPSQITFKETTADLVLYGVEPKHFNLQDIKIELGEPLEDNSTKEAIISKALIKALNLGDDQEILNQTIDLNVVQVDESGNKKQGSEVKESLKIIGIAEEEKAKFAYTDFSNLEKIDGNYNSVKIKVKERNELTTTRKAIESMGFPTTSVKDTVDQIDRVFKIIQSILGGFGMIALFVASIGIFNTMTISLLERTHEIGIMKAIGARDRDVSRVFTAESSLIGLFGGILGVAAGWIMGKVMNSIVNFIAIQVEGVTSNLFYTPINFIFFVIIFSFLISTFAGIWPAKRAAKLNPIEALRYE